MKETKAAESTSVTESGFEYYIENEEVVISKYTGSAVEVEIPEEIEGYKVTGLGERFLYGKRDLVSVSIPDSVTSIGNRAFYYCDELKNIKLPEKVTSIGEAAFSRCYGLQMIEIPESVTSIGEEAFFDCVSVTIFCKENSYVEQYVKEHEMEYVSADVFWTEDGFQYYVENDCVEIVSYAGDVSYIEIPKEINEYQVTKIGKKAFKGNDDLVSMIVPDGVISIEEEAFGG